jgi:hypothetical protein
VGALLGTVTPACGGVYDASTLGACREAVEAALLWCDRLGPEGAQGCATAVRAPLQAADRRVASLTAGCQQLPNARAQQACRDSIERSSSRSSRGNSGHTVPGQRGR